MLADRGPPGPGGALTILHRMPLRRPRTPRTPELRTDPGAALAAGVALLAGRDFAPRELLERIARRGFAPGAAEAAVAELKARGMLNEARYAENYVEWHSGRGHGPLRIAAELRQRGIAEELIGAAVAAADWPGLARKVCRAKFGAAAPGSWREQARRMRFLQYRGFSSDHIRAATGADPDWTEET